MMEESVEAPLIVTQSEAGNSVSYKRLKLLAAQLHDLKMDWEDLSENTTADNTEMDQFKALIKELETLTAQKISKSTLQWSKKTLRQKVNWTRIS